MAASLSCAVCGNASPEFVCAGCSVQRYCSDACYDIGWNSGEHAPSCQSQQQMMTGAPPEDRRRRTPDDPEVDPEGQPPVQRLRAHEIEHITERDDAGRFGKAETGESAAESKSLQRVTERMQNVRIGEQILLGLEPSQLAELCSTSAFYRKMCAEDSFRAKYWLAWYINVTATDQEGKVFTYSLTRTRTVGDVKRLYERASATPRIFYAMMFGIWRPTSQTKLGNLVNVPGDEIPNIPFQTALNSFDEAAPVKAVLLTHWLERGLVLDVSQARVM